ncbi:DEAD/DEAH box helicase [Polluticaenibacter yanchengensis]|uniref:DEAD/DEAH box helicase n=1 Tax=Polluticaenibacter yanchengensis TaxID=3014562 RepID=A0ABT4UIH3_9BACT|nr:DEAD/DEAH box helicase [Chitinophagaceae bacterium LY-5]
MTFEDLNLNAPLLKALDEMGFVHPTTIQQKAFSVIMSGKDVCGIAQTGTGKTYAYLLPCLRQLEFSKDRFPQMLVIVPTRELVMQVVEAAIKLTAYRSLSVIGVYGGVNIKPQVAAVENGVDVLVATPGRLYDLILNGALKTKSIKKFVIDEVDEMLNLGFRSQLKNIMELLPERRQNLMFSATITEEVEEMIGQYFNTPVRIEAAPTGTPLENINQMAYEVPNFYTKVNLLELLLNEDDSFSKVLIFAATKKLADELYAQMQRRFPEQVGVIHSNKEQGHRFDTVKQFKEGSYRFIIATDIVARGIDIAEVTHVINFDLPEAPENYMHRIGRTGRADKKGIAISFITERDKEYQEAIESLMKYEIPLRSLPDNLEISTALTEDEMPKVFMKEVNVKIPKRENVGAAFHEKSAKNNRQPEKRVSHKEKMMAKYGKPKSKEKKR